jgi:hypothetical protein
MPYIKLGRRYKLDPIANLAEPAQSAGELNYQITMLVQAFIVERMRMVDKPLKYCMINDVMGALEGAKQEFYRRVAVPYEDHKIKENGEVYYLDV